MANGYSQTFTLKDIFNNPKLEGKLPLVNYKETEKDGKMHRTTSLKTVPALVYSTAKVAAKPYYHPFKPHKSGNVIELDGTLIGDIQTAYNAVKSALISQKGLISLTANNGDIIRSALKEAERTKMQTGESPKLWLRVNSMLAIENMSKPKLYALMDDIMQNIFYNNEYGATQESYAVQDIKLPNTTADYEEMKMRWLRKVGAE